MSLIVRGIPQTKAALERVRLEIEAVKGEASKAGGEVLARAMVSRAPRRTGQMASEIGVTMDADTAKVGSGANYARFVQSGTRFMSAQPFETEAADETTSSIVAAVAAVLKAAIH